jgi:hypothetical protein
MWEGLSFVGGLATGLLTWWITERRARRQPYLEQLVGFLQPLQIRLTHTKTIADHLRGDLADLEYPHLVEYFNNLPNTDPRKFGWRKRIEQLQRINAQAVQLIVDKGGTSSPALLAALHRFLVHALEWEVLWEALESGEQPSEEIRVSAFPQEVTDTLEKEIAAVGRRAGFQR